MKSFVLDTNILTLLQEGDPKVAARIRKFEPGEIGLTIITVDEDLTGWHTQLRKSAVVQRQGRLASVYRKFTQSINLMKMFTVYSFTEPAMECFKKLQRAGYNIGGNDLRIAAIAMEFDLILVTRNTQHFHRIPDLHIEVW